MAKNPKLSNKEAAIYLGVKENTLEIWRCKHKGPRYSKLGTRVLYDLDDLEEFFNARLWIRSNPTPDALGASDDRQYFSGSKRRPAIPVG